MTRDEETSSMSSQLRRTSIARERASRLAAIVLLAAALAGCNTVRETVDPVPTDYRLRHPITLQERNRTVELFIGTNRGGLTPAQRADVLAFAHVWKREATGGVVIDVPTGTPNERAAADSVHEIQSILGAAGVPPGGVRPYRPSDPTRLATIRLNYPRIAAEAGPCGLWPNDLGLSEWNVEKENRPYWNLGCATQRNLAAMVDNPADLAQPRGETPTYSARRSVVLDKYRKGEGTTTNYPNANQGKISDVGQ
jgi:pilus assembly protein CpaD